MAAALHPDLTLLGVTTVWGNHDVRHTTDNTLRVLDYVGRGDVPVHAGRNQPFRPRESPLPSGRDDLPSTLDLPAAVSAARSSDAVAWLVDTLRVAPEPVTLVPTGPLTNIAAAVEAAPDIVGAVRRVVALAGTHVQSGVRPLVERNVWCDPEAAAYVAAAGFDDLTFVGMDATFAAALDAADADRLAASGTPAGETAGRLQRQRIEQYGGASAPLHDPLAVAMLLDERVARTEPASVAIDLEPGPTYGRTAYEIGAEHPDVRVALDADRSRFLAFLCEALG
jgi:inosine-uridine nucleoside N-ribohydrolase